ncbi:MAG: redoxin domain-containing protein, partial [Nitrospinota bacterium]
MFCREQMAQLRRAWPEFQERKIQLVAVSPAEGAISQAVSGMLGAPFACLGDPTGEAYDAFGLGRAGMTQVINFHTFSRGLWAMLRGHRQGRPVGDRARLPGAFLIDGDGVVRWFH